MAGVSTYSSYSNSSRGNPPDKTAIGRLLKQKFERVGCPHTENVDETWLAELVFHPSEARLRILHWLLSKFHRKLYDMLDPTYHQWSNADSRLQRLLFVASSLGLCRPNDIELIQGTSPMGKQLAFVDHLLDLVIIMDSAEDRERRALRPHGCIDDSTHVDEQFAEDCRLVDNYCTGGYCGELNESAINLLPVDVCKVIEKAQQQKLAENVEARPELEKLSQIAIQLREDVAQQEKCLAQMQHVVEESDPRMQQKVTRLLKLTLSELQQMLTTFSYAYDNDIEPWCPPTSESARADEFGARFKHVYNMADSLVSILQSVNAVRTTAAEIQQLTSKLRSNSGEPEIKYLESMEQFSRVLNGSDHQK